MLIVDWLYALSIVLMALWGFNYLYFLGLAWRYRQPRPAPPSPAQWPRVLVQLPLFNEAQMVDRLIDTVVALDYPADHLWIQVLDDSTDECALRARARVAYHRLRGVPIAYVHRVQRIGYKGGALAAGLATAQAAGNPCELVAVFDADFVPPADFLRRVAPWFSIHPRLGMAQARWEHLNAEQNWLTRAQAIVLDAFFSCDQVARDRGGLLMNFNGSAGVWRTAAIEAAGGWQGDTLAEDLDLSYRTHLAGWQMLYLPDVAVPAELPPSIMAFKQQQFRWAKGSFQVMVKLGPQLLRAPHLTLWQKAQGLLHMGGYFPHALMALALVCSLPVVLGHGHNPLHWSVLSLAGLGLPLTALWGQWRLRAHQRAHWAKRLVFYPVLFFVGIGLAVMNTRAILEALLGTPTPFVRTPKFLGATQTMLLPIDWATWVELLGAGYALATALLAVEFAPELVPFLVLYALGLGFTAALGLWQSGVASERRRKWQVMNEE